MVDDNLQASVGGIGVRLAAGIRVEVYNPDCLPAAIGALEHRLTSDEEEQLEAWNRRHRVVSAIAEKLADFIVLDPAFGSKVVSLTATEMLEVMGYERPTNPQAKECAAALRELLGESKRINGINKWRVPLKEPDAESLKPITKRQESEEIF